MPQDVGEAQQDGQLNAAGLKFINQVLEVDGLILALGGMNGDVAVGIDAEVTFAPVPDAVGLNGILGLPLFD